MNEIIKRFIINRAQPLGIISAMFLPGLFGFHLPGLSAVILFEPIILIIAAISNFIFFLVLDFRNKYSPEHLRSFLMIYIIFIGMLTVEILPLYVGVLGAIFHEGNAETSQQKLIADFVVVYGFIGSFLYDLFNLSIPKISNKLLSILKISNRRMS